MSSVVIYRLFVGVDIAAVTATVTWEGPAHPATRAIVIDQTPAGYASLHERLAATGIPAAETLVVLEATSTYWKALKSRGSLTGAGANLFSSFALNTPGP